MKKNTTNALLEDDMRMKNMQGMNFDSKQLNNEIDFRKLLEDHKKRTEKTVPFTL